MTTATATEPVEATHSRHGGLTAVLFLSVCALAGLALGIATALPGFDVWGDPVELAIPRDLGTNNPLQPAPPPTDGPQPHLVLDEKTYDFGRRENGSQGSHTFTIQNTGDHPLEIVIGRKTCKCTIGSFGDQAPSAGGDEEHPRAKVPPGESIGVTLDWTVQRMTSDVFRQTVDLLTNDRQRPRVVLSITGRIAQTILTVPPQFNLGSVLTTETATGEVQIESLRSEPLELTGYELSNEAIAEFFEVELQPLASDELKAPDANSGWRVQVTLKPGLPPGQVQQTISLSTNADGTSWVRVPVQAIIDTDFAIIGRGWDAATQVLTIGKVPRERGFERKLHILVRGPLRDAIKLEPPQVHPEELQVELGEPETTGNAIRYPLTIQLPANGPTLNYLGTAQNEFGDATIATSHPQTPAIRLRLRFATE